MKSSISIVLFFLLSGFFLSSLLGALEHSRKLLGIAGGCLAAVVCVIVFLTPVQLPSWRLGLGDDKGNPATGTETTGGETTGTVGGGTEATGGDSPVSSSTSSTAPPPATGSVGSTGSTGSSGAGLSVITLTATTEAASARP